MKMSKCENDQIVNYIITWLCYGDEEAAQRIAYTADESALETHDVIIVPNCWEKRSSFRNSKSP